MSYYFFKYEGDYLILILIGWLHGAVLHEKKGPEIHKLSFRGLSLGPKVDGPSRTVHPVDLSGER